MRNLLFASEKERRPSLARNEVTPSQKSIGDVRKVTEAVAHTIQGLLDVVLEHEKRMAALEADRKPDFNVELEDLYRRVEAIPDSDRKLKAENALVDLREVLGMEVPDVPI
jgi:hypothetical protein